MRVYILEYIHFERPDFIFVYTTFFEEELRPEGRNRSRPKNFLEITLTQVTLWHASANQITETVVLSTFALLGEIVQHSAGKTINIFIYRVSC